MVVAPSCLRARVQPSPSRCDHDVLQEHAVIQPGPSCQPPVDGKDHPDRRVEELKVAPVLGPHLRGLTARDPQPAVEIPAYRPPPGEVRFEKRVRIILDLLLVASFLGIEHRLYGLNQRILRGSGQHVPPPRLHVRSARRPCGDVQNGLYRCRWHRGRQEPPDGTAGGDRAVDGDGIQNRHVHDQAFASNCRYTASAYICWHPRPTPSGRAQRRSPHIRLRPGPRRSRHHPQSQAWRE
jgi:hypothetical protein